MIPRTVRAVLLRAAFWIFVFCLAVPAGEEAMAQDPETGRDGESAGDASALPYESDILAARPVRTLLGLSLGGYAFQHLGSFSPNCSCSYSGEKGLRLHAGLELSRQYPKAGIAAFVAVQYRDYSAVFTQRGTELRSEAETGVLVETAYERNANVELRSVHVIPGFAWYIPTTPAYISAGIDIGFPLRARYDNVERLTGGQLYYDSTATHTLMAERDIPGAQGLSVAVAVGIGMDIYLSDRLFLTPALGAAIPLTGVSDEDTGWRVMSEHAALILKVRL
jgi:hypothetical protein